MAVRGGDQRWPSEVVIRGDQRQSSAHLEEEPHARRLTNRAVLGKATPDEGGNQRSPAVITPDEGGNQRSPAVITPDE